MTVQPKGKLVWVVSQGMQDDGSRPLKIFTDKEKALIFADEIEKTLGHWEYAQLDEVELV